MLKLRFCNCARRAVQQPGPSAHCLSRGQSKANRNTDPEAQSRQQDLLLFHYFRPSPTSNSLPKKTIYPPLSNLSRQNKQKTKLNSKKQLNKQHLFLLFPTNHTSSILNPHGKYQRKKKKQFKPITQIPLYNNKKKWLFCGKLQPHHICVHTR